MVYSKFETKKCYFVNKKYIYLIEGFFVQNDTEQTIKGRRNKMIQSKKDLLNHTLTSKI